MYTFLFVIGVMISLFSLFMVAAAVGDLYTGSDTETGVLVGLLLFFLATLAGGAYLSYSSRRKKKATSDEATERAVLKVIMAKGGRITPVEVAAETTLSVRQSRMALERLCTLGLGSLQITDSGELVYVFKAAPSEAEKLTSKGVLEA